MKKTTTIAVLCGALMFMVLGALFFTKHLTLSPSWLVATPPANNTPVGNTDAFRDADGMLKGWVFDPDATTTPTTVNVYIGDSSSVRGSYVGTYTADMYRPDVSSYFSTVGVNVSAYHGFNVYVPMAYRDGVTHYIYIDARDVNDGNQYHIGNFVSFNLPTPPATGAPLVSFTVGINLSAAENSAFGCENGTPSSCVFTYVPPTHDWAANIYTYPTTAELDYFRSKGMTLIRLPIAWEAIQPGASGALDSAELSRLTTFISQAQSRGMKVIIDIHNFDRFFGSPIGSPAAPVLRSVTDFANLWSRLATAFNGNAGVYAYDLMNEPHDEVVGASWPVQAQAAINAIRAVDTQTIILVEGDNYSHASTWPDDNVGLENITDPSNKIVYEAHQYFDLDGTGRYLNTYDYDQRYAALGSEQILPFIYWLKQHGKQGFIGESGVPTDQTKYNAATGQFYQLRDLRWNAILDSELALAQANNIPVVYWSAGPWSSYTPFSIEPLAGALPDRKQWLVLSKYLTSLVPSLSITANGVPTAASVNVGASANIAWSATNVQQSPACNVSKYNSVSNSTSSSYWVASTSVNYPGGTTEGPFVDGGYRRYTLFCNALDGVAVVPAPLVKLSIINPNPPALNTFASSLGTTNRIRKGSAITLSWNITGLVNGDTDTTCSITSSPSGALGAPASNWLWNHIGTSWANAGISTNVLFVPTTFTLMCSNPAWSAPVKKAVTVGIIPSLIEI